MSRRKARKQAFLIVFEKMFKPDETIQEIIEQQELVNGKQDAPDDIEEKGVSTNEFTLQLADSVCNNMAEIDVYIQKNSLDWNIGRISKVSLSILRICVCEMIYFKDIPESVSINEAVELAKEFGGEEEAPFVNGVLSGIFKELKGK